MNKVLKGWDVVMMDCSKEDVRHTKSKQGQSGRDDAWTGVASPCAANNFPQQQQQQQQ